MVVCYLGFCLGSLFKKRRLSNVREANKSHVSQKLQFKDNCSLSCFSAGFGKVGSLTDGTLEMYVSSSAFTASYCNKRFPVFHQILHDLTGLFIDDHGAAGYFYDQILAILSELVAAHAVLSGLGFVFFPVLEVQKSPEVSVSKKDYASAFASVSSIGASVGNVGVAPECDRSVSALA